MKCTEVCQNERISAYTLPAISGTLAVAVVAGLYYAGMFTNTQSAAESSNKNTASVTQTEETGIYKDGTYTGTGKGFRGSTKVTVTVENGNISDITVDSSMDDDEFFSCAENGVTSEIIEEQDIDVDAVSGATFSSNGIKEAVADALGIEFTNPNGTAERGHGGRHSR
jgi:uncharacterized protein with FMN-binding domain